MFQVINRDYAHSKSDQNLSKSSFPIDLVTEPIGWVIKYLDILRNLYHCMDLIDLEVKL